MAAELDTLLAARDGDQEAGRRLVAAHAAAMQRTAWSVLGRYDSTGADDAVQEAFIAALTTDALPHGDVGAWLRSITARKALDELRRVRRRGEQAMPERPDADAHFVAEDDPHASAEVIMVRQALARLSPTDRAVLTLVDLEGRTMAEAAEALGSTRAAVKWRAVRARRKLEKLLRGDQS